MQPTGQLCMTKLCMATCSSITGSRARAATTTGLHKHVELLQTRTRLCCTGDFIVLDFNTILLGCRAQSLLLQEGWQQQHHERELQTSFASAGKHTQTAQQVCCQAYGHWRCWQFSPCVPCKAGLDTLIGASAAALQYLRGLTKSCLHLQAFTQPRRYQLLQQHQQQPLRHPLQSWSQLCYWLRMQVLALCVYSYSAAMLQHLPLCITQHARVT